MMSSRRRDVACREHGQSVVFGVFGARVSIEPALFGNPCLICNTPLSILAVPLPNFGFVQCPSSAEPMTESFTGIWTESRYGSRQLHLPRVPRSNFSRVRISSWQHRVEGLRELGSLSLAPILLAVHRVPAIPLLKMVGCAFAPRGEFPQFILFNQFPILTWSM